MFIYKKTIEIRTITEEETTMKKMILAVLIFTLLIPVLGTTVKPVAVNAQSETFSIHDYNETRCTVYRTKHFLALRTEPRYSDRNIIGHLHNGDIVYKHHRRHGEYVWVYSPDYNCYGWVNGNYLK